MENMPDTTRKSATVEQRLNAIEKDLEWQKTIHRNVGEDGNIYHYWNILPVIAAAAGIGVVIGVVVTKILK
jgi:hypothetical protein